MATIHIDSLIGGTITITKEQTAPNGKVLYKTSADGEWLESDADITNGTFSGFDEKESAVAVIIPSKDANGNDVTSIGDEAFWDCDGLTSMTIPSSVTSIGSEAFSGCIGLTSVTIPDSMTEIGTWAFFDCTNITELNIPDSVISIGFSSFSGTSVENVVIGRNVSIIGDAAFMYCHPTSVVFKGKTLEQVRNIEDGEGNKYYPWGIPNPTDVITVA